MQTKEIEAYSVWARRELMAGVAQRAYELALDPEADNWQPADAVAANGRVLPNEVQAKRAELARRIEREGYGRFVERMAYTWFNRLVAIRYMEVHDFLPSHVRVLSSADATGAFEPQALRDVATLELPGLDPARVAELIDAADDEGLFREVLLAQCNELAGLMPRVFGEVGGADALMLPANLLRPDGVVGRLVSDVPLEAWESVEVLGWMYQFYISERKDEVFAGFKKKQKATADTLGPATQLFTPEWIVRYMVENSLGRLWMLNHPESRLRERMEYYIEPEGEAEDFVRVSSPEEITLCDPACGSGHILVCAFDLLYAMYEEAGYRAREIPELILSRNLYGFEIDERAAELAVLALCMKGREHDRRLFFRGVAPNIQLLESVELDEGELDRLPNVNARKGLADALAHLSEVGSLFRPEAEDVAALEADLATLPEGDLFAAALREKLQRALAQCKALAHTYACVVANPPYMGSSNFNVWLGKWVKKHYPDEKSDLCTCFIMAALRMCEVLGYVSMVTASSWMFLSSFESFRASLISNNRIASMIQQSTHGFPYVTVPTTMFTLQKASSMSVGTYIRLEEFDRPQWQEPKALEAIHNPDCGWSYRADAERFRDIPGSPIAYWASRPLFDAFDMDSLLNQDLEYQSGLTTGANELFLREWWEISSADLSLGCRSNSEAIASARTWFPCLKGGGFRRWYGNHESVLNWKLGGIDLKSAKLSGTALGDDSRYFEKCLTWGRVSSGRFSLRYSPEGFIPEHASGVMVSRNKPSNAEELYWILGYFNTSVVEKFLSFLSPTLNFTQGPVSSVPIVRIGSFLEQVAGLARHSVVLSRFDWDRSELSWDFSSMCLIPRKERNEW